MTQFALVFLKSYLSNKVELVIKFCSEYFGIKKVIEKFNDHKHANFFSLDNSNITVVVAVDNWTYKTKN